MNRYRNRLNTLKSNNEIAFVPFTVLGFPNSETSFQLIKTLIKSGADMLELGFPYSDPIADGPIIQNTSYEAIKNGSSTKTCFELLKKIRHYDPSIPIGLLVYAQIIYAFGIEDFFQTCATIQIDSVLIADLPFSYRNEFLMYANKYAIDLVFILPPNCDPKTALAIQTDSNAYVYVVSRNGITGSDSNFINNQSIREHMKEINDIPHFKGFGISTTKHVKQAVEENFNGVIVGSKIISVYNQNKSINDVSEYIKEMKKCCINVQVQDYS